MTKENMRIYPFKGVAGTLFLTLLIALSAFVIVMGMGMRRETPKGLPPIDQLQKEVGFSFPEGSVVTHYSEADVVFAPIWWARIEVPPQRYAKFEKELISFPSDNTSVNSMRSKIPWWFSGPARMTKELLRDQHTLVTLWNPESESSVLYVRCLVH